jgi:hypothetical protein
MNSFRDLFQTLGTEVVGPAFMGLAMYALIWIRERFTAKQNKHENIYVDTERNNKIYELLTEIRITLKAQRSYLCRIHNGQKYIEDSEIIKYTRVNESPAPGFSYEADHYKNLLTSLMHDEMVLVTQEGASFTKVKDLKDGKFKRMLLATDVKAVARCAVRKNADIIGFIGIDYTNTESSAENIEELCKYAGIIEQVLSSYRDKK